MTDRYRQLITRLLRGCFWCITMLLVLLFVVSWVLSVYVDGVEGLLTPRGIRWMCSHLLANFATLPLASILMGLMALSVLRESGLSQVFRRHLSLKQRRALQITGLTLLVVLGLFSLLLLLPRAILLSAFGTLAHSAFSTGSFGLLFCLLMLMGNVYGYTSGRFVTLQDFLHAHVALLAAVAPSFVFLFLGSQLVECLQFTGLLPLLGDEGLQLFVLKALFCYVPLLLYVLMVL